MATSNETLLTITVYDTRAVVKNLMPGTEYLFQVRTNKGKDFSVAVEKKVITSNFLINCLLFYFEIAQYVGI